MSARRFLVSPLVLLSVLGLHVSSVAADGGAAVRSGAVEHVTFGSVEPSGSRRAGTCVGRWATVETVTAGYNAVGAAVTLNGNSPYVTASSFTDQGRIASRTLGSGALAVTRTYGWNTATGRLESMTATQGGVAVQQDSMVYDPVGNLLSVTHDQAGVGSDHSECFSYDARSRLVQAYTTVLTGGAPCPAGSTVSGPGGYLTSLAVDEIGNLTQGPDGVYSYLASGAGSIRPHAPTATSNSTMVWNNDGTLATKTVTATSARLSYTWDGFNRLTKVTDTTIPTSPVDVQQMIYGPGGERVLMKDTAGVHLYLGGLAERHLTGAVVTDKRYYTIGGTTVAVRTKIAPAASYVDFLLGDIRGSIAMTVRENTTTTTEQWYTPYGTTRAGNTTTTTTRGYIGQTHDTTTNLNYLHNRYQDPQTGVFLSVDPLVGKTGEPYLYANGNPTTLADPRGLCTGWICNAQDNKAAKADWQRYVAEFEASTYEKAARENRASELNAAGFFIARVLDPFHDAVGIDIAARSGGSFEIGCGVSSGQPDLCHPGTFPKIVGELKYDSPFGRRVGPGQLDRYVNPGESATQAGAFGSSGFTMVGVLRFDWYEDVAKDGLYFYKLNDWNLSALLAGMAAALSSNRNLQAANRAAMAAAYSSSTGAAPSAGANDWAAQSPPSWVTPVLVTLTAAAVGGGLGGGYIGGSGMAWHAL